MLLTCPGVFAATIDYVADPTGAPASITGKVDLAKIGSVPLNRGRVSFSGDAIDITVIPEWQFDRQSVFSGYLVHTNGVLRGNELLIDGLAYFDSGDWLLYIDNPKRNDIVNTGAGEVQGKIVSVTPFAVEMDTAAGAHQTIPLRDITDIDSARVYHFALPAVSLASPARTTAKQFSGQPVKLTMSPTTRIFRLAALKKDLASQGDGDMSVRSLVIIGTLLSAANMAQCLPEIFMLARQGHWARLAESKQFETLVSPTIAPGAPVPVPLPRGVAF